MQRQLSFIAATTLLTGVVMATPAKSVNPFFQDWQTPFATPPFEQIQAAHFMPALKEGMKQEQAEVEAIVRNPAAPTFENTIEAFDNTGKLLSNVNAVFSNLKNAESTPELQAIAKEVSPLQSAHDDDISLNEGLFKRIKAVYDQRNGLKLATDQALLLEKTYKRFVRNGVNLGEKEKTRLRAINSELGLLAIKFSDNLLKETNGYKLVIDKADDLAGLPEGLRASGASAAAEAGLKDKWVYTLHAPSIWPFLTYAKNRELRKAIFTAYISRCDQGNAFDNKDTFAKIASLRAEKAQLLGYATWAHYVLENNMAKTPDKVNALLDTLWTPAIQRAKGEVAEMQAIVDAEKGGFQIAPWDWFYYADKVKKAKYALDDEALQPYFPLAQVRQGAFDVASKLYDITFTPLSNMPVYHKEVMAFEVKDKQGGHVGVFYLDYHPRPGKKVGAWMSNYRNQYVEAGKNIRPIIVNVANFSRPVGNAPALLTLDETRTLFHEFGHALHGLLSQCRYRAQSGTRVAQDFVELPSQVMEHWAMEPSVLKRYAKHYQTGAPLPDALIEKIQKAEHFNQGFKTVEYLAASKLDIAWHTLTDKKPQDVTKFEGDAIKNMGLISQIVPRYRTPYFNHVVAGYDAGYYAYIWAAVLDTDVFQAFKEKGDIFHPATAKSFKDNVLSKGGSDEPMTLYKAFRGSEPKPDALLKKRGLK